MGLSIAILAGCSVGLGAILLVAGMIRSVPNLSTQPSTTLWTRLRRRWETLSRGRRVWVICALLAGLLVAVASGWLLASVLIPVKNGGLLLGEVLDAVAAQQAPWPFEVIDSMLCYRRWIANGYKWREVMPLSGRLS